MIVLNQDHQHHHDNLLLAALLPSSKAHQLAEKCPFETSIRPPHLHFSFCQALSADVCKDTRLESSALPTGFLSHRIRHTKIPRWMMSVFTLAEEWMIVEKVHEWNLSGRRMIKHSPW